MCRRDGGITATGPRGRRQRRVREVGGAKPADAVQCLVARYGGARFGRAWGVRFHHLRKRWLEVFHEAIHVLIAEVEPVAEATQLARFNCPLVSAEVEIHDFETALLCTVQTHLKHDGRRRVVGLERWDALHLDARLQPVRAAVHVRLIEREVIAQGRDLVDLGNRLVHDVGWHDHLG
ncbi:hypothetical protein [Pseudoclavibacter helvolus]|uniref:hypothetical protein n=1 Tax=Pseudoclavibacter helvolus TaxID=255205 RepID=UPI003C783D7C